MAVAVYRLYKSLTEFVVFHSNSGWLLIEHLTVHKAVEGESSGMKSSCVILCSARFVLIGEQCTGVNVPCVLSRSGDEQNGGQQAPGTEVAGLQRRSRGSAADG